MSHFAKVENNIVTEVIVAEQDFIDTLDGEWIQTSYNTYYNEHRLNGTPLRGNYAGIGYTYDRVNDVFYAPQPFGSWILNTNTWAWEPPIERPSNAVINGGNVMYRWDEDTHIADNTQGWVVLEPLNG